MKRVVPRVLPNGDHRIVYPFHVSLKGLDSLILCRDNEDYDIMVKYIAICSRRKNVIVIIYAVVSNHCHIAVLAATQADADSFAQELKRMYSMWFCVKYNQERVLNGVDAKALLLENDWHLRNALAYIPRNSLDNGCPVHEYEWSGFKAMFSSQKDIPAKPVAALKKRDRDAIMHTRDSLKDTPWLLDGNNRLVPASFCDTEYLEQVFNDDQAYFLKVIGMLNVAEMEEKLVDAPRRLLPDTDFRKEANDVSQRWFSCDISELTKEKKYRLMQYIRRSRKTTVSQLARAFELDPDDVKQRLRP